MSSPARPSGARERARRWLGVGLLVPLAFATFTAAGCGTDREPTAEVEATSLDGEPGNATPVVATPTPDAAPAKRGARDRTPTPIPTAVGNPAGDGASPGTDGDAGDSAPQMTLAPRPTPVPSSRIELAFLRQLHVALIADMLLGDAALRLGTRSAIQDFAQELRDRDNPTMSKVTYWIDNHGMPPWAGMKGAEFVADARTLGISTNQLVRSRNIGRVGPPWFLDEPTGRDLDAEIVDLWITHHEDTLALVTGKIEAEGNEYYLPLARRVERWMREDLPTLRTWKRRWR